MNKLSTTNIFSKPIAIGIFGVFATLAFGASVAFLTGFTTPSKAVADIIAPPCCTLPTPPAPVAPPPPPPAPAPEPAPALPPPPPPVPIMPPPPPIAAVIPPPTIIVSPILGCMDSTATNYDPAATSQAGVTCTYPVIVVPPPVVPPVIPPPPSGGGGGGGGGGGSSGGSSGGGGGGGSSITPTITLAALPHINAQPLVYLYLSQIPYTGLDLGPIGTTFYWIALIGWSIALAYLTLFTIVPFVRRSAHGFGERVSALLNVQQKMIQVPVAVQSVPTPVTSHPEVLEESSKFSGDYSPYEGFKSFAHNGALSIEDIVKGLSRADLSHEVKSAAAVQAAVESIKEDSHTPVQPVHVEDSPVVELPKAVPVDMREFVAALVEGDRTAVFTGLREYARSAGTPEHLVGAVACLLDDTYRARVAGAECDAALARLTARLDTPTLERLVAALSTGIESTGYADKALSSKLALARALSVLGA